MSPVSGRNGHLTEIGCSLTPACADCDREALVQISTLLRIHTFRTEQLTSRRCILNIYSTNILTEYFKHAAHFPFFLSVSSRCRLFHNAVFFGSCNIHILNTGCAKILKQIPAPKG